MLLKLEENFNPIQRLLIISGLFYCCCSSDKTLPRIDHEWFSFWGFSFIFGIINYVLFDFSASSTNCTFCGSTGVGENFVTRNFLLRSFYCTAGNGFGEFSQCGGGIIQRDLVCGCLHRFLCDDIAASLISSTKEAVKATTDQIPLIDTPVALGKILQSHYRRYCKASKEEVPDNTVFSYSSAATKDAVHAANSSTFRPVKPETIRCSLKCLSTERE
jgi:hypothetical protein